MPHKIGHNGIFQPTQTSYHQGATSLDKPLPDKPLPDKPLPDKPLPSLPPATGGLTVTQRKKGGTPISAPPRSSLPPYMTTPRMAMPDPGKYPVMAMPDYRRYLPQPVLQPFVQPPLQYTQQQPVQRSTVAPLPAARGAPFRKGVKAEDFSTTLTSLAGSIHDPVKVAARAVELERHPELRLRVDIAGLRPIVDYDEFLCHPKCSVSRDQAKKGSDIDEALVITKQPVSPKLQAAFVAELQCQGFTVCSEQEGKTDRMKALHQITFRTHDELSQAYQKSGLLMKGVLIWLGGNEVGSLSSSQASTVFSRE